MNAPSVVLWPSNGEVILNASARNRKVKCDARHARQETQRGSDTDNSAPSWFGQEGAHVLSEQSHAELAPWQASIIWGSDQFLILARAVRSYSSQQSLCDNTDSTSYGAGIYKISIQSRGDADATNDNVASSLEASSKLVQVRNRRTRRANERIANTTAGWTSKTGSGLQMAGMRHDGGTRVSEHTYSTSGP